MEQVKIFNDETYFLVKKLTNKREAQLLAKRKRETKRKARVVKYSDGYAVYVSEKKR